MFWCFVRPLPDADTYPDERTLLKNTEQYLEVYVHYKYKDKSFTIKNIL